MTVERIVKEIEARIEYLEPKVDEIDSEIRRLFFGMTDEQYRSMGPNHPKKRRAEKINEQVRPIGRELHELREMLYAYKHS